MHLTQVEPHSGGTVLSQASRVSLSRRMERDMLCLGVSGGLDKIYECVTLPATASPCRFSMVAWPI